VYAETDFGVYAETDHADDEMVVMAERNAVAAQVMEEEHACCDTDYDESECYESDDWIFTCKRFQDAMLEEFEDMEEGEGGYAQVNGPGPVIVKYTNDDAGKGKAFMA